MGNKRVLVIEDEKALSSIMVNMLEVFGYEGEIASTGREAMEQISRGNYDYIILDITLPDISGSMLYEMIMEKSPEFKGKIIFTSGFETPEEIEEILERDGGIFLPKPFSVDKFQEVLNKLE